MGGWRPKPDQAIVEQDAIDRLILALSWVAASLVATAVLLQWIPWRGTRLLHALMDTVAASVATVTSVVAYVRYYSRKDSIYLVIATGFVSTALLDTYHVVVSSGLLQIPRSNDDVVTAALELECVAYFLGMLMLLGCRIARPTD